MVLAKTVRFILEDKIMAQNVVQTNVMITRSFRNLEHVKIAIKTRCHQRTKQLVSTIPLVNKEMGSSKSFLMVNVNIAYYRNFNQVSVSHNCVLSIQSLTNLPNVKTVQSFNNLTMKTINASTYVPKIKF